MRPQYSIITQPATEPITEAQATSHLRVDSTDDADYIAGLIPVAREYVDSVTGRVSSATTWRLIAANWQDLFAPAYHRGSCFIDPKYGLTGTTINKVIPVFRTPLVSVTSIKYHAPGDAALTTMSTDDYRVITSAEPGLIHIHGDLPAIESRPDAIQIEFIAGIAAATSAIHKHTVKLLVSHLYENRVPINIGNIVNAIPFGLQSMIENQKIGGYF